MFTAILDKLLKEKGIPVAKMLEDCKIGKNQYTYWKKNNNIPNGTTLQKLADYFGVSVDFLLDKKNNEKEKPAGITDELWNALCKDDVKMDLAIQISQMSPEKAKRVLVLLQAAQMLPPEESNPADTE